MRDLFGSGNSRPALLHLAMEREEYWTVLERLDGLGGGHRVGFANEGTKPLITNWIGFNPKSEIGTAHLTQSFGHPWFKTGCGVLI